MDDIPRRVQPSLATSDHDCPKSMAPSATCCAADMAASLTTDNTCCTGSGSAPAHARSRVRLNFQLNAGRAAKHGLPDAPTADEVDTCTISKALLRDELTEPCMSLAAAWKFPAVLFAESRSWCAVSRAADTPSETPPSRSEAVSETAPAEDFAASASTTTQSMHARQHTLQF